MPKSLPSSLENLRNAAENSPYFCSLEQTQSYTSGFMLPYLNFLNKALKKGEVITSEDIKLLIRYCDYLFRLKNATPPTVDVTVTKACLPHLINVLLKALPTHPELFSAFENLLNRVDLVQQVVKNIDYVFLLLNIKEEDSELTGLERLLINAQTYLSLDEYQKMLGALAITLSKISGFHVQEVLISSNEMIQEAKEKLAFLCNALKLKKPLTIVQELAQEDKYDVVLPEFQKLLQFLNVTYFIEDPELFHFLAIKKSALLIPRNIEGIVINTSRKLRLKLLCDAMENANLSEDYLKLSAQILANNLVKNRTNNTMDATEREKVILASLEEYVNKTYRDKKSKKEMDCYPKAKYFRVCLQNALKTAIKKRIEKTAEQTEQWIMEKFEDLLSKNLPEAMALECDEVFSESLCDTELTLKKHTRFFQVILDNNANQNLKKVAQALMSPVGALYTDIEQRQNFWSAVSDAEGSITIFTPEYRKTLMNHLLNCLKEPNISTAVKERAIKCIHEQLMVIQKINGNIDVLLPVLLKESHFQVLKALYKQPESNKDFSENIQCNLNEIFTACYTHQAHDALYTDRAHGESEEYQVSDWEFLVEIKHENNTKWATSNLSTIKGDSELKLREEQDFREKEYQKNLKKFGGIGFVATWNLMNNRHDHGFLKSFQNFFKTMATYLWAKRPTPEYTKNSAKVILLEKDPEGEAISSGFVTDKDVDDAVTVASDDSENQIQADVLLNGQVEDNQVVAGEEGNKVSTRYKYANTWSNVFQPVSSKDDNQKRDLEKTGASLRFA